MKNAFSRMSSKCALMIGAGVLMAGGLFAGQINEITVTLPHAVSVGSTTLPAGQYVISSFEMGGEEIFIVRGNHTPVVTLLSERTGGDAGKTQVTLSKDGDQWHFDKLSVEGDNSTYQFVNSK
jgi:hypothetical protein